MAEVTSFKGIFEYMYIKNAKVFFIKGILMMILTFRNELLTRIRIRIQEKISQIQNPGSTPTTPWHFKSYLSDQVIVSLGF